MEKKKMTTIAVSPVVRDYLNELRGKHSADEFLLAVLTYLTANGIDPLRQDQNPTHSKMSNCNDVMKRLEDVIKIVRSAEKNINGKLDDSTQCSSHAKTYSQLARESEQQKETIEKLRQELINKEEQGDTTKAARLYNMTIDFIDNNPSRDGGVYVGKARTAHFRDDFIHEFHS